MTLTYELLRPERVLAIDPNPKGFGYVVLEEDPFQLVDWGAVACRSKTSPHCLLVCGRLIQRYDVSVVVLEDPRDAHTLRKEPLTVFLDELSGLLSTEAVPLRAYSREEIRSAFSEAGAATKHEIAEVLVGRFPELVARRPRKRNIWEGEDARMTIFDALSLAVTHLARGESKGVLEHRTAA